ncbi:MAG: glycosyl hydrolase 115 family protein [Bacteroidaceae bacterium]|nr:glycosyl hydrolase 115 family protein [Bacteroidaceae bacterium]
MRHIFAICVCFIALQLEAQRPVVTERPTAESVEITNIQTIVVDAKNDYPLVQTVAQLWADDYKAVTGKTMTVLPTQPGKMKQLGKTPVIVAGTVGHSAAIDRMAAQGLVDTAAVGRQWERYVINAVPERNVVVIAGSDRRGTAYGLLELSRLMGVSPWYWWDDIPAQQHEQLHLSAHNYAAPSPSVKYRGLFINDEDWSLTHWAKLNYEKELGNIGPRTYARVCELLLRLGANMLAPAMHSCSTPFYQNKENMKVADKYGIVVTTSHCEPLLFNNASKAEWDTSKDGPWDYKINRQNIYNKLNARVAEACGNENIYTTAIRGLHDAHMQGGSQAEKLETMKQVLHDEREILQNNLKQPADRIPQIFVCYKEVQDLYEAGIEVPDDITMVWVDDNYGYLKRTSTPEEQKRTGGAGIYYHSSYLGTPHDYLWLNTTPPALIFEEMRKAYDTGARNYWLINVGDIKPNELALQTFIGLARDIDSVTPETANTQQAQFLAGIFGQRHYPALLSLLTDYYQLAWMAKPEYMGWEREWDNQERYQKLGDTDFSPSEVTDRLLAYRHLAERAEALRSQIPESLQPAFVHLLYYPMASAAAMNHKHLLAQLNRQLAKMGKTAEANQAAQLVRDSHAQIASLCALYNETKGEKWQHFMQVPKGLNALYQNLPNVTETPDAPASQLDLVSLCCAATESEPQQGYLQQIPLSQFAWQPSSASVQLVRQQGLGYEGYCLQMGRAAFDEPEPIASPNSSRLTASIAVPAGTDSVTIHVYALPLFPLNKYRTATFGIALDAEQPAVVTTYQQEWTNPWKDNVMRNSTHHAVRFAVTDLPSHQLHLVMGDPGTTIQRVAVEYDHAAPSIFTSW